jgi:RNA polymerase sigma-70 factor (ECF subfamily)
VLEEVLRRAAASRHLASRRLGVLPVRYHGAVNENQASITRIIKSVAAGDRRDVDQLLAVLYDDLHALASRSLRGERPNNTLQPTALVHEAYLRLVDQRQVEWRDRSHFFALASEMIRRILVDHARGKQAAKRGGGRAVIPLEDAQHAAPERDVDLAALDEALNELADSSPQQAKIVEMRFFGGLTVDEVAMVLEVGKRTVDREWAHAKAWLFCRLEPEADNNGDVSGKP